MEQVEDREGLLALDERVEAGFARLVELFGDAVKLVDVDLVDMSVTSMDVRTWLGGSATVNYGNLSEEIAFGFWPAAGESWDDVTDAWRRTLSA